MRTLLSVLGLLVVAGLAALWWQSRESAEIPGTTTPAQTNVGPEALPDKITFATATSAPSPAAATQANGNISFIRADAGETLDLPVAGGAALWDPQESRLRVLLTDESLSAPDQRQMLEYLRDQRMADAGRRYGLLELYFRPGTTSLDRSALISATLTVGNPGDLLRDTADVLSSIQWTGQVQLGSGAQSRLDLTSAGRANSVGATPQQNWNLSVSVPVVELARP